MTEQPTALYFADVIANDPCSKAHHDAAAAELRRLSAENRALTDALFQAQEAAKALLAQRDALLEALRELLADAEFLGWDTAKARAAIKAVEEGK